MQSFLMHRAIDNVIKILPSMEMLFRQAEVQYVNIYQWQAVESVGIHSLKEEEFNNSTVAVLPEMRVHRMYILST